MRWTRCWAGEREDSDVGRIPGDDSLRVLDPLTIGAADDDSKVYREVLEIDIPQANLLAAIYPPEPTHLPDATAATAAALSSRSPGRGSPS